MCSANGILLIACACALRLTSAQARRQELVAQRSRQEVDIEELERRVRRAESREQSSRREMAALQKDLEAEQAKLKQVGMQ